MLLAKFAWRGAAAEHVRETLRIAGIRLLSLQRGVDIDEGYAYLDAAADSATGLKAALGAALHDVSLIELEPVQVIPGASASQAAPFHYVVETDVLPEREDELNAWYIEEHMPGLAAVPGAVHTARYRNTGALDTGPRYHAAYDLVTPDTLGTAPWLAVRGTAWASRIRPAFRNTKRTMFRRVAP